MTTVEIVLSILEESAETAAELFDIFMVASIQESMRRMQKYINGNQKQWQFNFVDAYRDRQKFYSLLYRLKKQGFIKKEKKRGGIWSITKAGFKQINKIKAEEAFIKKITRYSEEITEELNVITFDIPEYERRKRSWLRLILKLMGFSRLQQSVFIGRKKIPREFLFALRDKKILKYVQIFSVHQSGSLEPISIGN